MRWLLLFLLLTGGTPESPEEAKKKLQEIQKKQQEVRKQIALSQAEIQKILRRLGSLDRKVARRQREVQALDRKLGQIEIQQRYLLSVLRDLDAQRETLEALARKRVVQIYKEGNRDFVERFLEARDELDIVDALFYARTLLQWDYELLRRLRGNAYAMRVLLARYEELEAERRRTRDRKLREVRALEAMRRRLREQKRVLEQKVEVYEAALEELEREGERLTAWLREHGREAPGLVFDGVFLWPVQGRISSRFSRNRWHPILKRRRPHKGLDIAAPRGTPVKAAAPGVVIFADYWGGYGNVVILDHGLHEGRRYQTRYAHLSQILVQVGETVEAGDLIGRVGSTGLATGPNLHFEIRVDGEAVDPLKYLPR